MIYDIPTTVISKTSATLLIWSLLDQKLHVTFFIKAVYLRMPFQQQTYMHHTSKWANTKCMTKSKDCQEELKSKKYL